MVSFPAHSLVEWIVRQFASISVMTTSTPEKLDGLKALEGAIEKINETITKLGGVFKVQMAVRKIFFSCYPTRQLNSSHSTAESGYCNR